MFNIKRFNTVKCRSINANENIFYVYFLGRYNNKPFFHYGQSTDISSVEFNIKKSLPYYDRIIYNPVDHNVCSYNYFDNYLSQKKLKSKLPLINNDLDVFTVDENTDFTQIEEIINNLFKAYNNDSK